MTNPTLGVKIVVLQEYYKDNSIKKETVCRELTVKYVPLLDVNTCDTKASYHKTSCILRKYKKTYSNLKI
ncbi:hypothetical protein NQ317_018485 [Molorchus minor]|uniref:Uncharacterized protein n=1 Tax=Molorchus minor TaxID=1323400 RepID=A0ABQ9J3J5_9CUCU|nr:hypothetical protein NQ317_018485 [Molorchus minor]